MTTVELTEKEADIFLKFREHQGLIAELIRQGIFEMRNGSITVHYGVDGQVKIETRKLTVVEKA